MTGLYNKISGINYVKNELRVRDSDSFHALYIIDIDNFKNINDNLGHAVGDKVIIEAANIISGQFRDSDIVFRFGGDEFAVFAVSITMDYVKQKAANVCEALRRNYGEGDNVHSISASIGISCFPFHGQTYDELFNSADTALYKTKENGKNSYTIYSESEV
jgi:diguanylate cyclase (GGDEF)-like protein